VQGRSQVCVLRPEVKIRTPVSHPQPSHTVSKEGGATRTVYRFSHEDEMHSGSADCAPKPSRKAGRVEDGAEHEHEPWERADG
jgi:hypothetical protein